MRRACLVLGRSGVQPRMPDERAPGRTLRRGVPACGAAAFAGVLLSLGCETADPATGSGVTGGAATGHAGAGESAGRAASGGAPQPVGGSATGGARPSEAGGSAAIAGGTSGAGGAPGAAAGSTATGGAALGGAPPAPAGGTSSGGAPAGGANAGGESGVDPSAELYDPERLPRFDLELSESAMDALDEEPEVYVEGTFRYGTESVARIGVRIKGEASRRNLREKAAFKLKFDEFVDDQTFRGLRRLTFNNMVEDPSFLAERLAYHVFRAAGLPAPRCNSALVYVNGDFFGVYANIEAEDKTFLRRWFTSDAGNLYEEGGVDFVEGAEAMFNLETNETKNDRSDLANLISVFHAAEPETFLADLDAALDTAHFLRFTAAEVAVNQPDMYAYTMFYPNNFRIYMNPETQKFVFIPWGMDMSMKPFRDSDTAHIPIFELAHRGDRPSEPVTAGLIFQRCLESASCKARYAEVVAEIADVYEGAELEALARRYYDQIAPHVEDDPRREYSDTEFERGYESLLSTIRQRPAAMRAELAP